LPGPQGQQGWAPKLDSHSQQVANWVKPATWKTAPGFEPSLTVMFTPVELFASAFDAMIKLQRTWADMLGTASTGVRAANKY
jgi:hypothetical protein